MSNVRQFFLSLLSFCSCMCSLFNILNNTHHRWRSQSTRKWKWKLHDNLGKFSTFLYSPIYYKKNHEQKIDDSSQIWKKWHSNWEHLSDCSYLPVILTTACVLLANRGQRNSDSKRKEYRWFPKRQIIYLYMKRTQISKTIASFG